MLYFLFFLFFCWIIQTKTCLLIISGPRFPTSRRTQIWFTGNKRRSSRGRPSRRAFNQTRTGQVMGSSRRLKAWYPTDAFLPPPIRPSLPPCFNSWLNHVQGEIVWNICFILLINAHQNAIYQACNPHLYMVLNIGPSVYRTSHEPTSHFQLLIVRDNGWHCAIYFSCEHEFVALSWGISGRLDLTW